MPSRKKILFIDSVHPCLREELEKMGYDCEWNISATRAEIEKIIHAYFGIVVRSRIALDSKFIALAKNLKFIARSGSGMENIDVKFAKKKGIVCVNSPEGNRDAVAEQALAMLLCLFNNICRANAEVRKGYWNREKNRGIELKGKTIGIVGFGNTGSAFVNLLHGFDAKVLVYDKYKNLRKTKLFEKYQKSDTANENEVKNNSGIFVATMNDIFKEADILSLHIPLTDETNYLIDDGFIKKFKKNIYIINTSRGPIVKTVDLVSNMKKGKVLGACLDVIEYEESSFEHLNKRKMPEAMEYLRNSEKVVLTPHIAGWTFESYRKLSMVLAEKIKAAFGSSPETHLSFTL